MITILIIGVIGLCIVALHYAFGFYYDYISEGKWCHSKEKWQYKKCMMIGAFWNFVLFFGTLIASISYGIDANATFLQKILWIFLIASEMFAIGIGRFFWIFWTAVPDFIVLLKDAFTILFSKYGRVDPTKSSI